MAETYYDAIRNFSEDEMARFLRDLEMRTFVPKRYSCDNLNCSCFDCKEDLICFKDWLSQEVEHETK